MSHLTTHVLDGTTGRPAVGVTVTLTGGDGVRIAEGVTNADGRIGDFGPETLPSGTYQVTFDTGSYFAAQGVATFYPTVTITVAVDAAAEHYHVPLLLSPFAYSTYRGS